MRRSPAPDNEIYRPPPDYARAHFEAVKAKVDAEDEAVLLERKKRDQLRRRHPQRIATLGDLLADDSATWVWALCGRFTCPHRAALPLAPLVIRWGSTVSSDKLRRALFCTRCGHRGGVIQVASDTFEAFPLGRRIKPWRDQMCNRYRRKQSFADYREEFSQTKLPLVFPPANAAPNFLGPEEVAPTDPAPIFRLAGDGLEMALARWWLVPAYWKSPFKAFVKKAATFNARVETADKLPTFRDAFSSGRCLIPADGWFEFTGEKKPFTRWLIERADGEGMMLAGLWSRFNDPETGPTDTFTMVMQPAFEQVRHIHHRAPIPLAPEHWKAWLEPNLPVEPMLTASQVAPLKISKSDSNSNSNSS